MDWREERALVERQLAVLLPGLAYPYATVPLGSLLSRTLSMPEKRCCTVLGWIAKTHPNATHDGRLFRLYGRAVQGWRWHPQPQRDSPADPAAAGPDDPRPSPSPADYVTLSLEDLGAMMGDALGAGDMERFGALRLELQSRRAGQAAAPDVDTADW